MKKLLIIVVSLVGLVLTGPTVFAYDRGCGNTVASEMLGAAIGGFLGAQIGDEAGVGVGVWLGSQIGRGVGCKQSGNHGPVYSEPYPQYPPQGRLNPCDKYRREGEYQACMRGLEKRMQEIKRQRMDDAYRDGLGRRGGGGYRSRGVFGAREYNRQRERSWWGY